MENKVKIISMDTVEAEEIKWLWKPYIPFGKLTIIQGDPGEGKTTFALHIAALLSQGKGFDGDTEPFEPDSGRWACRYSKAPTCYGGCRLFDGKGYR